MPLRYCGFGFFNWLLLSGKEFCIVSPCRAKEYRWDMDQIVLSLKALFSKPTLAAVWAVVAAVFSHIFGLVDGELMVVIFYLVVIDTFTGLAASISEGQPIISRKLFRLAVKVVVYSSFIGLVGIVGRVCLNSEISGLCLVAMSDGNMQTLAVLWVIGTEIKSVIENLGRSGVSMPKAIKDKIDSVFTRRLEEEKER
jgi:phage-related holin